MLSFGVGACQSGKILIFAELDLFDYCGDGASLHSGSNSKGQRVSNIFLLHGVPPPGNIHKLQDPSKDKQIRKDSIHKCIFGGQINGAVVIIASYSLM